MNFAQRLLARLFPPYRFKKEREKGQELYLSIMNMLPFEFDELKKQSDLLRFNSLSSRGLYPGFLFLSMFYPDESYRQLKKKGHNYIIQGLKIFNLKKDTFEPLELLIQDNTPIGIKIGNGDFNLFDLDPNNIKTENIISSSIEFEPDDTDKLWNRLSNDIQTSIQQIDFQEIELSGRKFYQIFDLEDGNCIAINKKQEVFSLVHDASPMSTKMKISLLEFIEQLNQGGFDKEAHLRERYKKSR